MKKQRDSKHNHYPSEAASPSASAGHTGTRRTKRPTGLNTNSERKHAVGNGTRKDRQLPHRKASYIVLRALIAVAIVVATALAVRLMLLVVSIKDIEVSGPSFYTEEELCAAMEIEPGDALFGFKMGRAEKKLLETFPMLSEVTFHRSLGGKLTISVSEEQSSFFVFVSGNYYVLGRNDYRVLYETEDIARLQEYGLYEISLPDVRVAFLGEVLEFGEEGQLYYLDALFDGLERSDFAGRITGVRAADRFNVSFIVDDKYNVTLGTISDLERKLSYLSRMMTSENSSIFKSGKDAEVNLSNLKAPTARTVERINTTISG